MLLLWLAPARRAGGPLKSLPACGFCNPFRFTGRTPVCDAGGSAHKKGSAGPLPAGSLLVLVGGWVGVACSQKIPGSLPKQTQPQSRGSRGALRGLPTAVNPNARCLRDPRPQGRLPTTTRVRQEEAAIRELSLAPGGECGTGPPKNKLGRGHQTQKLESHSAMSWGGRRPGLRPGAVRPLCKPQNPAD